MLDVPLPHVPCEKRMAVLNKLLSDMRKSYIQEQVRAPEKRSLAVTEHACTQAALPSL